MRRIGITGKGITVFALGLSAGLLVAFWWGFTKPKSPLTHGLPPGWDVASSEFDSRIRARFPIGIPVRSLRDALLSEGFEATWFEADGEYGAMRDESDFVCKIVARVYWRVGQKEEVATVRGRYHEEGCL